MKCVLVTFATRTGSTEEVARFVADVLREHGLAVDVLPVSEVNSLAGYGGVVLAAALYMGRLHNDARRFLRMHYAALIDHPVALLIPGPVQKDEKDWAGARQQLEKELGNYPWLSPIAQYIIGGRFDPAKLGFPFNLLLRKLPANDARDWTEIRTLAGNLAETLRSASEPGSPKPAPEAPNSAEAEIAAR